MTARPPTASKNQQNQHQFQSATTIAFGPSNELLVADSAAAIVYSFNIVADARAGLAGHDNGWSIKDIDAKMAKHLDCAVHDFKINFVALNPKTKEPFVSVTRGRGREGRAHILAIAGSATDVHIYEPKLEQTGSFSVPNPVAADKESGMVKGKSLREISITTLNVHEGHIYVAGLSNTDFGSSLHKVVYPFTSENKSETVTVEMYHAVHNMNETRAPIRAAQIVGSGADSYMIAAYTCTPIVLFKLSELKTGSVLKGKTIGELGFGNTPTNVIRFSAWNNATKAMDDTIMVTSRDRIPLVFSVKDAVAAPAIDKQTMNQMGFFVEKGQNVPMAGPTSWVTDFDNHYVITFVRDVEYGSLNLVTCMKGAYFRISNHTSEFEMPGFKFVEGQKGTYGFQKHLFGTEQVQCRESYGVPN